MSNFELKTDYYLLTGISDISSKANQSSPPTGNPHSTSSARWVNLLEALPAAGQQIKQVGSLVWLLVSSFALVPSSDKLSPLRELDS